MRKLHNKCEHEQHSNKDTIVSGHLSQLVPPLNILGQQWAQFVRPTKMMIIIKERFARNVCDLFTVDLFAGSAAQHLPKESEEQNLITVRYNVTYSIYSIQSTDASQVAANV